MVPVNSNTKLDHRSPKESLMRARACLWIGFAVAIATTPLIPATPIIPMALR
jgi:hypothetical protein